MPAFKTPFNGYAVRFSPFFEGRLVVGTAQNYGILGNGRLHVLDLSPAGITESAAFDTAEGIYDCCWSEHHESIAVSAVADGSLKLWDVSLPPAANPIRDFREHAREVHAVDWNTIRRDSFVSASWDDSLKLWTIDRPNSVRTFREHNYCVYAAAWTPRHADVFASASGDCTARVWDVREPGSTLTLAHPHEILSCDWNKYDPCCLATACIDKFIRVWDIRAPQVPIAELEGHGFAVRRVRFSPHRENVLVSCSYDMTVCVWDYKMQQDALLTRYDHHTEFAVGIDMSVFVDGLMASTGWDELVYVWPQGTDPRAMT